MAYSADLTVYTFLKQNTSMPHGWLVTQEDPQKIHLDHFVECSGLGLIVPVIGIHTTSDELVIPDSTDAPIAGLFDTADEKVRILHFAKPYGWKITSLEVSRAVTKQGFPILSYENPLAVSFPTIYEAMSYLIRDTPLSDPLIFKYQHKTSDQIRQEQQARERIPNYGLFS